MFRISVCYGQPTDPAAFEAHYTSTHTPLTLKVPGLAGFTTGKPRSLMPGRDAPYYMIASLMFSSAEDLKSALKSPEMAAASADVANFATGGVTLYRTEEIDRG
ncbi:EthD family reductase [Mycolicibacterium alvei]|uniref:Putative ethyl tert-butyl ether degradation protein EthD n=1 Tax=Mycolicibacterium alvei TaxID=67081 RepID=A0A6N4URK9_9MYCO|nr:EthD family reductase [Mycolicibacterium alvei]MCV7003918.1 EthD family reductase [Mycolicibacterium alvei]BBX27676.1 putative ethyl tert-butyl ether degradation protein EthD [Mycolicibacterium alvei]